MTTPTRKPMTFNVGPPAPAPMPAKAAEAVTPPAPVEVAEPRQQVGARVSRRVYRELKSRAALSGVTVAALVERAIVEFLDKGR